VFFVAPVRVQVARMLLNMGRFTDMFRWRPNHGTEVICVPIDRPHEVVRFTVDPFFQWHFANAHDDGRRIIVDYVRHPDFAVFAGLGELANGGSYAAHAGGRLHRATIDLERRTISSEELCDRRCEFPTIASDRAGRAHASTYLQLDDLAAVGRFDTATGRLVAHELPATQCATEPVFVARPAAQRDDDGHVLALCHDGPSSRAFLAIYDAARIEDGPLARAWFDHPIPITFHGTFVRA
jgi:all-trans-8'-apo-beta-carotenal 15,15'-oxygenase